MVVMDSIIRLVDNVISSESLESESFDNNLLDYPNYTKTSRISRDESTRCIIKWTSRKYKQISL